MEGLGTFGTEWILRRAEHFSFSLRDALDPKS